MRVKSLLKQPTFYHWMTAPLFNAGTVHFGKLRSYHTLDTCPKSGLKAWLIFQGVRDGNSYHNQRRWLLYEGYRKEFNELSETLSSLSFEARVRHLSSAEAQGKNEAPTLACVHQLMNVVPPATIAAFDFALLVALNKAGERLNLLDGKEAAFSNMDAVKIVQSKYASWYEFYSGCIAGVYFRNPPKDTATLLPAYAQSLLEFSRIPPSIRWDYPF
ncbi:DUF1266 domain-containing protein [Paenibacillus macerans]|uniref:DUF1266 domain-containing protein n=1 Tax=Paenibacillus macerans TaxID=44252 RepID=UPI00203CFBCA|nr:DUF1266 domain-containing protein [Paenibacillus macerans]MCM3703072.1 DUF1266 domain-containing protein [Paenibacillus macerans]